MSDEFANKVYPQQAVCIWCHRPQATEFKSVSVAQGPTRLKVNYYCRACKLPFVVNEYPDNAHA
jgi:hypothetical protein